MEEAAADEKVAAELVKLVSVVKQLSEDVSKIANLVSPTGDLTLNVTKAEDALDELEEPFKKAFSKDPEPMETG